ncbi:MAG: WYL domain-containing protein [Candidatus Buchananbacteria bacterium]|jgi:predicted DNA-binding transcriptional regulator YafY
MKVGILEIIRESAQARKVLKIIYIEKDGSSEGWRYVEPYSFSHDNGESGLFAWDINKGGIRRFSLERIVDAEVTQDTYLDRYNVEI